MRIQWIILAMFLLFTTEANAQLFRKGRLFTQDGDTLEGLIASQGKNTFAYKQTKKGKRKIYNFKELTGFEIAGERYQEHFIEVIRNNFPERTKAFLKVIVEGPLMLLEYKGEGIFGNEHVNFYLYNGEDMPYRVNRNPSNFKGQMKRYFHEVEDVRTKVKSKEYTYENLPEMVEAFNQWYMSQPVEEAPVKESDGTSGEE